MPAPLRAQAPVADRNVAELAARGNASAPGGFSFHEIPDPADPCRCGSRPCHRLDLDADLSNDDIRATVRGGLSFERLFVLAFRKSNGPRARKEDRGSRGRRRL